jgi:hypothetical protein
MAAIEVGSGIRGLGVPGDCVCGVEGVIVGAVWWGGLFFGKRRSAAVTAALEASADCYITNSAGVMGSN